MRVFRIADRRFPIFDGTGARLVGGRWNSPGRPLIYAAESFAGAMLEMLVHSNLSRAPRGQASIEIEIPDDLSIERIGGKTVPGWMREDMSESRRFGDRWLDEARTAVLIVPGMVTCGREHNILINPLHPEFARIRTTASQPVAWDDRLFQR